MIHQVVLVLDPTKDHCEVETGDVMNGKTGTLKHYFYPSLNDQLLVGDFAKKFL